MEEWYTQNGSNLISQKSLLTTKCPMKHMKRIKDKMRKAIPKDIPKAAVLQKYNSDLFHCLKCQMQLNKLIQRVQEKND